MYYKEHWIAVRAHHGLAAMKDASTQWNSGETNAEADGMTTTSTGNGRGREICTTGLDILDAEVEQADDPHEQTSIVVTANSLPVLSSPGILQNVPLPTTQ